MIILERLFLKRIIVYSSVAHMGLVTLAIFSHTIQGLVAAIFLC